MFDSQRKGVFSHDLLKIFFFNEDIVLDQEYPGIGYSVAQVLLVYR